MCKSSIIYYRRRAVNSTGIVGEEKDRHKNVGIWVVIVLAVHTLEAVSYSYFILFYNILHSLYVIVLNFL